MDTFVLYQYILGKITAEKVQSYVPRFITQEQADLIILTPKV